jgi:hypothetical protein
LATLYVECHGISIRLLLFDFLFIKRLHFRVCQGGPGIGMGFFLAMLLDFPGKPVLPRDYFRAFSRISLNEKRNLPHKPRDPLN